MQQGKLQTVEQLEAYIRSMLALSWTSVDALAIKAVYMYIPSQDWQQLWLVDRLQHIQRASSETRNGVQKMGRRLLQLTRSIYPDLEWSLLDEAIKKNLCIGTHSFIHGWISYQLGVTLEKAVEGYLYCCMVTSINCALRLMSMGQTQGQVLLAKLLPLTEQAWSQAAHLDPGEAYTNTPAADLSMMQHETLYSRLFMS
ncbi:Urease accessory protein UreF [compost metagenome]